ncbi:MULTISPECIES: 3-hydroxybutyryl-CoA dehydrogenase [unclassified Geodermatophilus]|uniref:3-hydroxybutyryl-CoA dehydrogenase n=1 Tax=unclassified Geodermatophilus TaxID=2637632 RepID=UPI003EECCE08
MTVAAQPVGQPTTEGAWPIATVGVVGCGLMGSGIAEIFAGSGRRVVVTEVDARAAQVGLGRIEASLDRAVAAGKLDPEAAGRTRSRVSVENDLDALSGADLVVEAASENEDVKTSLFRRLDRVVTSERAVFASNTSSVPITRLGSVTGRPSHVVGLHFFNPVPVMPLVEVVPSLLTAADVIDRVTALAGELGKIVIRSQDRAGFIVNALLVPYLLSAIRMVDSGFATADDIDAGMVRGCAHPMGPLRLCDFIGLDTVASVAVSMYREFREPLFSPPPLLSRMVEAGLLGRKSGRGFFEYRT